VTTVNKRFKGIGSIVPEPRQAAPAVKAAPAAQPAQVEIILRDAHARVVDTYCQLPALGTYLRNNVVGLFELAQKTGVASLAGAREQILLLEQAVDDLCVNKSPLPLLDRAVSAWEKAFVEFLTSLETVIGKPQQGGLF